LGPDHATARPRLSLRPDLELITRPAAWRHSRGAGSRSRALRTSARLTSQQKWPFEIPIRPHLINQAATLGFSTNLDYRNTRCETFASYLRGEEALFNDPFAGGPGLFVYEEMPAGGRRGGIIGRGLEGALDAALKAFGI
jgi:hypothetical protein